jgi:type II secretory pathway predicted ATPase ExeA
MRPLARLEYEGISSAIHVRKSGYPNASQQVLLRALELTWNPGKTVKTIVTPKMHKCSAITEHENF